MDQSLVLVLFEIGQGINLRRNMLLYMFILFIAYGKVDIGRITNKFYV